VGRKTLPYWQQNWGLSCAPATKPRTLADRVRTRRPCRRPGACPVARRGSGTVACYELSFPKSQYEPKNAIFCPSLLPPSEPLLLSLQRATDGPLARRGSSSQVFDLACFVGDGGQRRERRMRIFSLLFPTTGNFPMTPGASAPFSPHLPHGSSRARPRRRDGCARGVPRPHTSRSRAKRAFF
jgi:hypothetical protein